MYKNPLVRMIEDMGRYGPVVRYRFLGTPIFLLSHPDGVERVLHSNHANYNKSNFDYRMLRRMLGDGLLTAENPLWLRQRRLIQPMFHRQRIAGFASIMTEEASLMLAGWQSRFPSGEPFDVSVEMMGVALRIASRALIDMTIGEDAQTIAEALHVIVRFFGAARSVCCCRSCRRRIIAGSSAQSAAWARWPIALSQNECARIAITATCFRCCLPHAMPRLASRCRRGRFVTRC